MHLHAASFSSSSVADAAEVQAPREDPEPNAIDDDAKEVIVDTKDSITTSVLPTTDDTDTHVDVTGAPTVTPSSSGDDAASSILNEDIPPPLEFLPEDTTNTDTDTTNSAATNAATDSIIDDKFQGIAPENVIRTGKIVSIE